MKSRIIAAVIGLAASAASQAQIVTPTTTGGSDLLLDVWEQAAASSAPDQSFTLNLGRTMTQFLASDGSSSTLATVLATDTTWTNFLASSSIPDLQWSVIASGNKVPTRASLLGTVTIGEDPIDFDLLNVNVLVGNAQLSTTIANLNVQATPNEQVNSLVSGAYYQTYQLSNFNENAWDNGNALGATGVHVAQSLNVAGTSQTLAPTTVLKGTMSFAPDSAGNFVLNYTVDPLPEAPGFFAMLAGLGALRLIGRRRKSL